MKIVGLTGGIGSGKTTVLQLFKELGAEIYISDIEAKKLMVTNKNLVKQITELFGEQAYINNELNRGYIADIVFNNKNKLEALNKLVHPKVRAHFNKFIKNGTSEIVIYESAILFESGSDAMCDFIITVTANYKDKVKRIMKRDKVTEQQISDRMQHQLKDDFKIKHADFVIENSRLEDTKLQVTTIYNLLLKQPKN